MVGFVGSYGRVGRGRKGQGLCSRRLTVTRMETGDGKKKSPFESTDKPGETPKPIANKSDEVESQKELLAKPMNRSKPDEPKNEAEEKKVSPPESTDKPVDKPKAVRRVTVTRVQKGDKKKKDSPVESLKGKPISNAKPVQTPKAVDKTIVIKKAGKAGKAKDVEEKKVSPKDEPVKTPKAVEDSDEVVPPLESEDKPIDITKPDEAKEVVEKKVSPKDKPVETPKAVEVPDEVVSSKELKSKPMKRTKPDETKIIAEEKKVSPKDEPVETPKAIEDSDEAVAPLESMDKPIAPPKASKKEKVEEKKVSPFESMDKPIAPPKASKKEKVEAKKVSPFESMDKPVATPKASEDSGKVVSPFESMDKPIDISKPAKTEKVEEKKVSPFEGLDLSAPIKQEFKPTRKTAEELIAEGVQDEVQSGIRYEIDVTEGIEDKNDPFKLDLEEKEKADDEEVDEIGGVVDVTADGNVTKMVTVSGTGKRVQPGSTVKVHYTGRLVETGKQFDSSYDRNAPFEFEVGAGKVIRGWDATIPTMRVGEKAIIKVEPTYAYGRRGVPPVIPSNAALEFEVEVVEAVTPAETKSFAEDNPDVARTADEIAIAYMEKMKQKEEAGPEKKGFFDRFYFISPFQSQTGERPPWWLNPNITFIFVFAFVAAAFYIVVQNGGVHQGFVSDDVNVNPFSN